LYLGEAPRVGGNASLELELGELLLQVERRRGRGMCLGDDASEPLDLSAVPPCLVLRAPRCIERQTSLLLIARGLGLSLGEPGERLPMLAHDAGAAEHEHVALLISLRELRVRRGDLRRQRRALPKPRVELGPCERGGAKLVTCEQPAGIGDATPCARRERAALLGRLASVAWPARLA
jgi:hypothetical protein